jgi:putative ABC transport system permease protein
MAQNTKEDQSAQWASVSPSEFSDYQEKTHVFDEVLGITGNLAADDSIVIGTDVPEIFGGARVTANTFRVLGVAPLLGRAIGPSDFDAGAPPVAVIGFNYWRSKFGGDPGIVGRTVILCHRPTTLIGVMSD